MPLTLEQNTKILHYLQQRDLDRLILNDFKNKETITSSNESVLVTLNENKGIIYNNSFTLEATENIIFKFPKILVYKFDKLRLVVETENEINLEEIECFLSVAKEAEIKNVPCKLIDFEKSSDGKFYELLFLIESSSNNDEDNNDNLSIADDKYSSFLSNIQSIFIDFKTNITINIHDIAIFTEKYDTTLEMIEDAYIEATNYISEGLSESQMKEKIVIDAIAKMSAINLWLIENQKEAKYQSGYKGTENYYDQLIVQVENAIRKFNPDFNKESSESEKEEINTNLVGSI